MLCHLFYVVFSLVLLAKQVTPLSRYAADDDYVLTLAHFP